MCDKQSCKQIICLFIEQVLSVRECVATVSVPNRMRIFLQQTVESIQSRIFHHKSQMLNVNNNKQTNK